VTEPTVVAFVFARGGSKGLPGKNLAMLGGVPMIGHAIRTALATQGVTRCVVSTDDEEIAATARGFGADTPFMRPPELATDSAPEWQAWRHAIVAVRDADGPFDVFLSVPSTSPLRAIDDVEACLAAYAEGGADVVITVTEARRNPYFNMVTVGADRSAEVVIRPDTVVTGREAAPKVYDMTTVAYVADPDFIMRSDRLFDGRVRAVLVPPERAVDIDTPLDLRLAELLLAERRRKEDA
jgi:N,N'-diacetyl-8-epilegionaminate cytidylyltransferase